MKCAWICIIRTAKKTQAYLKEIAHLQLKTTEREIIGLDARRISSNCISISDNNWLPYIMYNCDVIVVQYGIYFLKAFTHRKWIR